VPEGIMRTSSQFTSARPHTLALVCAALLLSGTVLGVAAPAQAAGDAALARSADLCAQVGKQAGFPRNQQLVVAVAIGLAESSCNSGATHRNRGRSCSVDRGLWQINGCSHPEVSVSCAFQARCNAKAAYRISGRGTNFRPWATYGGGQYRRFMAPARAAVNRLG
jgi:Lysozyme like domain